MTELVTVLIVWLSVTFGLPETRDHPAIRFESAAILATIRYGGPNAGHGGEVVALYDGRIETIFLSAGWDSSDPADVSVLVHELVHHLQATARLVYPCPEAREELAYRAQERWLSLFGKDLYEAYPLDPMTLKLRTSCLSP